MTLLFFHTSYTNHYGILLIIAGLYIRYQIGRRRFNRRSIAGVQIYSSYFKGLLTAITETLLNVTGALLIIIGLIKMIIHL
jgi:hypothetical protein